ncbi:MAG: hypothetical protein ACTSRU_17900 [Candidatus Hodarchaeales archaeon]
MAKEVIIVEAVRSAAGKNRGALKDWRPDDLAGKVISEHRRRYFTFNTFFAIPE